MARDHPAWPDEPQSFNIGLFGHRNSHRVQLTWRFYSNNGLLVQWVGHFGYSRVSPICYSFTGWLKQSRMIHKT